MGDQPKRKHDGEGGGSRKKGKSAYFSTNKSAALPLGCRGFLVSCFGGKEYLAAKEAIHLLTEFYEAAKPAVEQPSTVDGADISSRIESEVADLKDIKNRLFTYHKTQVNGLVFLRMADDIEGPGPVELVAAAAKHAKETHECKTRLCMRFIPVENVCYASTEQIAAAVKPLIEREFPKGEDATPIRFAVSYEHRASVTLDRMEVINTVVNHIPQPPHKVNLDTPDLTILLQLIKSSAGISIVRGYKEALKFNLRELAMGEAAEEAAEVSGRGKGGGKGAQADAGKSGAVVGQDDDGGATDAGEVLMVKEAEETPQTEGGEGVAEVEGNAKLAETVDAGGGCGDAEQLKPGQ